MSRYGETNGWIIATAHVSGFVTLSPRSKLFLLFIGICFSGDKCSLQYWDYAVSCDCFPGGFRSLSPVANLLGVCFWEVPAAVPAPSSLKPLLRLPCPGGGGGGEKTWPGNWKQSGLCPFCPIESCFPWGALRLAIQRANQKPTSLVDNTMNVL